MKTQASKSSEACFTWALAAILVAGALVAWIVLSWAEARSYNRATGSDVTTFEAMFVDLRIIAQPNRIGRKEDEPRE